MSELPDQEGKHTSKKRKIPLGTAGIIHQEKSFLMMIAIFFILAGVTFPYAQVAMWVGFLLAGYSAIANDSIQTIGTFLASNQDKKWYWLWLWIGGIFLITVTISWLLYDGDVSHQRLQSKGFSEQPDEFTFLQIAAPIFLMLLTRMRMPVSTTFLLLSSFSASAGAIGSVLVKSVGGYFVAFASSIIVWLSFSWAFTKFFKGEASRAWIPIQWVTSGLLWSAWVMQDAANIAVYLPRSLSVYQFLGFSLYIFFGLGLLFYMKGDRIQSIVNEKSDVHDVRSATVIDFIYAIILFVFKFHSKVPMSTTWVFIGLLAGREIAMSFTRARGHGKPISRSLRLMGRDALYAFIGLVVSVVLAAAINPNIKEEIINLFF